MEITAQKEKATGEKDQRLPSNSGPTLYRGVSAMRATETGRDPSSPHRSYENSAIERRSRVRARSLVLLCLSPFPSELWFHEYGYNKYFKLKTRRAPTRNTYCLHHESEQPSYSCTNKYFELKTRGAAAPTWNTLLIMSQSSPLHQSYKAKTCLWASYVPPCMPFAWEQVMLLRTRH